MANIKTHTNVRYDLIFQTENLKTRHFISQVEDLYRKCTLSFNIEIILKFKELQSINIKT